VVCCSCSVVCCSCSVVYCSCSARLLLTSVKSYIGCVCKPDHAKMQLRERVFVIRWLYVSV
jgi:hypothetical protein